MDSGRPRWAGLAAIDWEWDLGVSGGNARNGFEVIFFYLTRVEEESGCGEIDCGAVLSGGVDITAAMDWRGM